MIRLAATSVRMVMRVLQARVRSDDENLGMPEASLAGLSESVLGVLQNRLFFLLQSR